MLLLRHILSTLAGSRSYDPIRTQMKKSHRCRERDRRQRRTPTRVTARQCPTRRPVPNWKSLKRLFAWLQPTNSKVTRRRPSFNAVNKVAKTSEKKGRPTEGPNWTTWDEDTVEEALQEGGNSDEVISLVSGCPMTSCWPAYRPACLVSDRVLHPPIPTSSPKRGQTRVSHTPVTPLGTPINLCDPSHHSRKPPDVSFTKVPAAIPHPGLFDLQNQA